MLCIKLDWDIVFIGCTRRNNAMQHFLARQVVNNRY